MLISLSPAGEVKRRGRQLLALRVWNDSNQAHETS